MPASLLIKIWSENNLGMQAQLPSYRSDPDPSGISDSD